MAHRAFRGRGISQSQRRKKSWVNLAGLTSGQDLIQVSSTPNNTLNYDVSQGSVSANPSSQSLGYVFDPALSGSGLDAESTILRIRGSLLLGKNTETGTPPQSLIATFAFGIGVMETQAANLGAWPNPATVKGALWDGWMFYRSLNSSIVDATAAIVDVKSMRKLQSGQSIILVMGVEQSASDDTPAVAPAFTGSFTARALMMLP